MPQHLTTTVDIPTFDSMTSKDTYTEAAALPIGEVARLIGVSVSTIRNWERTGKINAFRTPGGQRRFPLAEVRRIRDAA